MTVNGNNCTMKGKLLEKSNWLLRWLSRKIIIASKIDKSGELKFITW